MLIDHKDERGCCCERVSRGLLSLFRLVGSDGQPLAGDMCVRGCVCVSGRRGMGSSRGRCRGRPG